MGGKQSITAIFISRAVGSRSLRFVQGIITLPGLPVRLSILRSIGGSREGCRRHTRLWFEVGRSPGRSRRWESPREPINKRTN